MKKLVDTFLVAAMLMAYVPSIQQEVLACLPGAPTVQMLLPGAGETMNMNEGEKSHGEPC